jgi:hypothetical protein
VIGKALLIIVVGAFAIVFGIKSVSGMETDAEHLHGGQFVDIACDAKGDATGGTGFLAASADQACKEAHKLQRDRAPFWLIGGAFVTLVGITKFRRARAG